MDKKEDKNVTQQQLSSKQFFLLFNKWSPPVKFDRKIESIIIMHIAFDA